MIQLPVEPKFTDYLHNKAARAGIPLNGTFELTPLCNMNCRMCYVRLDRTQQEAIAPLLSAKDWLELGRVAREAGMLYLLLTGGEPFLRPDFPQILTGLHQMGFVISINTNGTLIDEAVMAWLRETPPARVNLTLYGASDETYARLCREPRGFTRATRAIELLTQAGIPVKINCSVTPHNAQDLEGIFAYCQAHGLPIQATSYMFPPLRKDGDMIGRNDRFTPEEAAYWSAKIALLYNGQDRFLERMVSQSGQPMPQIPEDDCQGLEGDGIRCRAGKCCFWVTWNGRLLPCGMLPDREGTDVIRDGFPTAWENARQTVRDITLPAKCAACQLKEECKACAAMVYTETGTFDHVPEYRCQMTQAYTAQCQQLEKEIRGGM